MNIEQLMAYLPDRPSKNTVYKWTTTGRIPFFKLGKKLFFKKSLIDKWNEKRANQTTA